MKRINVVGTSGSGKTTFAKTLASVLDYPYIEMDAEFWLPNWTQRSDADFFSRLEPKLAEDTWVLDGNYSRTSPLKWQRADTVIWLDMSRWRTHYRVIKRSMVRAATSQELWSGNTESFRKSLLHKDSVILWSITSYQTVKQRYASLMHDDEFKHLQFIRLQTPSQVARFIDQLKN